MYEIEYKTKFQNNKVEKSGENVLQSSEVVKALESGDSNALLRLQLNHLNYVCYQRNSSVSQQNIIIRRSTLITSTFETGVGFE